MLGASHSYALLSKSKHWASPRQRVLLIDPAANLSFPLITPDTAGFEPMKPGTGIKRSKRYIDELTPV